MICEKEAAMVRRFRLIAVLAFVLSSAPPALAESGGTSSISRDPNQKVCEVQQPIGSRLGGKKVCMTRTEWAERRAADRESVEMLQKVGNMPCVPVFQGPAKGGATPC